MREASAPLTRAPAPADKPAEKPAQPAASAPAARGPGSGSVGRAESDLALHGTLSTRWRWRSSADARDQDAYAVLGLDVGRAGHDRVSAHVLGRLSADLDGQDDSGSQAVFGSLQDTHGKSAYFDVYEAFVDVDQPLDARLALRAGRQFDYTTPVIAHYDGVRVETKPAGRAQFVFGAFGGVPVRLYDATSIGDQIGGAWTEARPWTGGRLRADWMHVHEDADPTGFFDDLFGLSLWQRVGTHLRIDGGYTRLESEDRDVRLRTTWSDARGDLLVQLGYYQLLNPERDFAQEFDPYYATLQQYERYRQYRLLVSKSLGTHLRLDLGGDVRRLDDEDSESLANHDYQRGFATAVVSDFLASGLDLSLTGDAWDSDQRDVRTWGVDLTCTPNADWRVSAGSSYALYKFYPAQVLERDDVRTWYARVRRSIGRAWSLQLEYDYEDDDFDDFQQVTVGATWHF